MSSWKDHISSYNISEYRVGHCRPIPPTEPNCSCVPETSGCVKQKRDRVFNFHAFPWHRNENNLEPFTVAVFGDLGLKKPDDLHVMDEERVSVGLHFLTDSSIFLLNLLAFRRKPNLRHTCAPVNGSVDGIGSSWEGFCFTPSNDEAGKCCWKAGEGNSPHFKITFERKQQWAGNEECSIDSAHWCVLTCTNYLAK